MLLVFLTIWGGQEKFEGWGEVFQIQNNNSSEGHHTFTDDHSQSQDCLKPPDNLLVKSNLP